MMQYRADCLHSRYSVLFSRLISSDIDRFGKKIIYPLSTAGIVYRHSGVSDFNEVSVLL